MIGSSRQVKVWVVAEPVDMRKGYDGLFGLAQRALGRNVLEGDLFLFVGKSRTRAKVLYWDGTGLCVLAKRLEKGRFNAPWEGDASKPWQLTTTELELFLQGSRLVGHFQVSPPPFVLGPLG